jgi:hypothetical protein
MIFKEIGNRKNVEVICHYFHMPGPSLPLRHLRLEIFVGLELEDVVVVPPNMYILDCFCKKHGIFL